MVMPFDEELLNPASLDVTLGGRIMVEVPDDLDEAQEALLRQLVKQAPSRPICARGSCMPCATDTSGAMSSL